MAASAKDRQNAEDQQKKKNPQSSHGTTPIK
jgi:hypothetical protein